MILISGDVGGVIGRGVIAAMCAVCGGAKEQALILCQPGGDFLMHSHPVLQKHHHCILTEA